MKRRSKVLLENRREFEQFIKWSVVGALGALVDYSILIALVEGVHLYPGVAQGISFSAAVINNYIWNRLWTFGDIRHKGAVLQFTQFFVVSVVGLAIRTALFLFLFEVALLFLAFRARYLVATAVAIILVLIWNFFVNRAWTFREQPHSPPGGV